MGPSRGRLRGFWGGFPGFPSEGPGGPKCCRIDSLNRISVVALWEAFHIDNQRFYLDTLRVPSRSPTQISKSNDFLRQSDDIWGPGPPSPVDFGGSRGPGRPTTQFCLSPLKRPPCQTRWKASAPNIDDFTGFVPWPGSRTWLAATTHAIR